jgi:hypothetical protein
LNKNNNNGTLLLQLGTDANEQTTLKERDSSIIEYHLTIEHLETLNYLLIVKCGEEIFFKAVINITNTDETFFNLFYFIRKRNKEESAEAILYIPGNWEENDYIEFFLAFNADQQEEENHFSTTNNGITIVILNWEDE